MSIGQYVDILTGEPVNRSIPHISLHHVTRFEPITAAHFDQRYNIIHQRCAWEWERPGSHGSHGIPTGMGIRSAMGWEWDV